MLSVLFVIAAVMTNDPPPDLMGWASIITALGVTFASIVSAVTLSVSRRTDKKVTQIDHAVNGQPPGTKPMVNQVQDLHQQIPAPLDHLDQAALLPLVRRLVVLAEAAAERDT